MPQSESDLLRRGEDIIAQSRRASAINSGAEMTAVRERLKNRQPVPEKPADFPGRNAPPTGGDPSSVSTTSPTTLQTTPSAPRMSPQERAKIPREERAKTGFPTRAEALAVPRGDRTYDERMAEGVITITGEDFARPAKMAMRSARSATDWLRNLPDRTNKWADEFRSRNRK